MPVPVPDRRTVVLPHQAGPVDDDGCAAAAGPPAGPAQASARPAGAPAAAPAAGSERADAADGAAAGHPAAGDAIPGERTGHGAFPQDLTLLLIGADPNSPVPELWDGADHKVRLRTARNLTEAERLLTDDVHCILLDLAPPERDTRDIRDTRDTREARAERDERGPGDGCDPGDVRGRGGARGPGEACDPGEACGPGDELDALREVLRMAPTHAVLVLTSQTDAERAAAAVRVGAQDYLFRDELDGAVLSRAVRYAVERKRADRAQHQLTESRMLAQENARLERGLLPTPLLEGSGLRFAARYRPGRSRALLGGDFYDTVRTPDGTVHAMIGDVCGHGPDEAALGVELRIAWRALTFAGLCGDELLATLQKVLEHERADDEIFATLCTVDISPDGRHAGLCLAGHPAPLLARAGRPPRLLPYESGGPALGLLPHARWPRRRIELGGAWSLMMYTDGLIEGRTGEGNQRLGQEGMTDLVSRQMASGLRGEELLDAAVTEVRALNGEELTDDVAVLLLDRREKGRPE
ncbi:MULTISPECIES: PP2C family protein-serine/threonine phosphatase [Streptomyces]|uniref:PP2C family protein-serine/threonine phosphatase n=1 Tax=Streptomyces TaxID=1883 RepID=UPI00069A5812|nr:MULTISPECIES: PP2C family protein-serine/threonine phosphatase [Streptomyces]MYU57132.1 SpoIIE family protein phosphatase [Streptomyces sp. SID7805]